MSSKDFWHLAIGRDNKNKQKIKHILCTIVSIVLFFVFGMTNIQTSDRHRPTNHQSINRFTADEGESCAAKVEVCNCPKLFGVIVRSTAIQTPFHFIPLYHLVAEKMSIVIMTLYTVCVCVCINSAEAIQ